MNNQEKLALTTRGTVEIIQRSELEALMTEKKSPRAYWGFECSGKQGFHIPVRNDAHRPRPSMRIQNPGPNHCRI